MLKQLYATLIALAILISTAPARAQFSGAEYGVAGVRTTQAVKEGVVVDVIASAVATEASAPARMLGGAVGLAACAKATSRMSWQASIATAAACGAIGERIAHSFASQQNAAQTFIVRIDAGGLIAVTQVDPDIQKGQRVFVLTGQGTRIVKAGV